MNKEIETLINNLEGYIGAFDYMLTPIENNLLLAYINELQQENKKLHNKIDKAIEILNQYRKDWANTYLIIEDLNRLMYVLKDSDVDE